MAEINPFEVKDYLNQARERVTYAFEDATVFDKFLQLLVGPEMELQEAIRQLMQERSIDTAVGKQLDIIGDIVGQPRELVDVSLIRYFGFVGNPASLGYGDVENLAVGGYYWDVTTPLFGNVGLNDDQYRLFIKAKILKNVTRATTEDVIHFIKFVFNVNTVYVSLDSGAAGLILVSDDINEFEKNLLRYFKQRDGYKSYFIPKTIGVGVDFGTFPRNNFFSFAGVPGGKGYGDFLFGPPQYDGSFIHNAEIDYSGTPVLATVGGGRYASILEV